MAKSGVRRRIFLKKMASRRHCTEDEEKQKTGKRQKQKTRVGETKVWCFFKNEREKGGGGNEKWECCLPFSTFAVLVEVSVIRIR